MLRLAFFLAVNVGVLRLSWIPLRDRRSHGFYRFFAFESILMLATLNWKRWFARPFAPHQIVSWLLLNVSGFLALHGFYLLHVAGKPQGSFEDTTRLVRVGAYRYIRHPLYSSLLYLGWGAFFKNPSWPGAALALANSAALLATAGAEESEMLQRFGVDYAAYMRETRMFVPFVL